MGDSIKYKEYEFLMARIAWWLLNNNKSFKKRDYYNGIKKNELETQILNGKGKVQNNNINEFVECAIEDNKTDLSFLPNYVANPIGIKYYKDTFVNMAQRVSAYEVLNKKSPAIVYIQDPNNTAVVNATSTTVNDTYTYFVKKFGSITDFDSALTKVKGRKYGYYYNSKYSNTVCIDRMYNKLGINCTDSAQVFYKIALALGYTVQFVHVKCSGGDGHVRLRLKHTKNTGGKWIYRDPAAVLNGGAVTKNWCLPPAYTIAYDPSWIFTDL